MDQYAYWNEHSIKMTMNLKVQVMNGYTHR